MNDEYANQIPEPSVIWMAEAARGLPPELTEQIRGELLLVFAATRPAQMTVKQRFSGYSDEPWVKTIVAVEMQYTGETHSSVLKIGEAKQVRKDFDRWQECAANRGVSSRMFIAPLLHDIGNDRVIVEYPDVYQYYDNGGSGDEPKELETLVKNCIDGSSPSAASIERVLTQVFTEAHRCFYRDAHEDSSPERILHAVRRSLRIADCESEPNPDPNSEPVLKIWHKDHLILRQGAAWLTCGDRQPDAMERPDYVDPVDYMSWAIDNNQFPVMLVGPAHGDLHGRNIIAGVVRGEAEWPAVFDFDKMKSENLVAWDFVKLEMELKCHLLPPLLDEVASRKEMRACLNLPEPCPLPDYLKLTADEIEIQQQAERMEIIFAIEKLLRDETRKIYNAGQAASAGVRFLEDLPSGKPLYDPLYKALTIIFRIRREAALALGFTGRNRQKRWQDEYYFAAATYGLVAAKWDVFHEHLAWSLISAGVACAQLSQLPWPPSATATPSIEDAPTYLHALPFAHACWKNKNWATPVPMLQSAIEKFPYAVALKQELALCLASSDSDEDDEKARREIQSLANIACIYRDHETLCRLGRIHKDKADALIDDTFTHQEMIDKALPSYQHYFTALKYYKLAFDISQNYYPGVNAATLSMLVGDEEQKTSLAKQVLAQCAALPLDDENYTWILASEGEASLLMNRPIDAVRFYKAALDRILPTEEGTRESMNAQLERLSWALGMQNVHPIQSLVQTSNSP